MHPVPTAYICIFTASVTASRQFTILLSDTGCIKAEIIWYTNLPATSFTRGITHIIITTIIPAIPTAFLTSFPAHNTVLATLPIVLP